VACKQGTHPASKGRKLLTTAYAGNWCQKVTAETRLIPPEIAEKLATASNKLRVARAKDAPAWQAEILQEIDNLLDQAGRRPPI
jgi:hypothetical protein